jgi:serine carboxypeptidase-like clade 2
MSLAEKLFTLTLIGLVLTHDRISKLPDYPYDGTMYSGYLKLNDSKKQLHYIFVESQNSPKDDPIVLWLNGGPGCSSLLGWSQQHGPATFREGSDKFELNPHSWTKAANIIYLESPTNTGFSFNESKDKKDLYMDDIISGQENLQAIVEFFNQYPKFRTNEFHISGESYAGIYVPTLAWNIINYNKIVPEVQRINLKGMIVGNGVTDWSVDTKPATIELGFGYGLFSPEQRILYDDICFNNLKEAECNTLKSKLASFVYKTVNFYDVFRKCEKPKVSDELLGKGKKPFNYTPWLDEHDLNMSPPCNDASAPEAYFNRLDVKNLLHVDPYIKWEACSNTVNFNYYRGTNGSYYLYKPLIKSGLKILIYSGDSDAAVPVNGTRKWIKNLRLHVERDWKSWKVDILDDDSAGYIIKYKGLTFVTFKGVGHFVPQWKPAEAYHMFTRFLKGMF